MFLSYTEKYFATRYGNTAVFKFEQSSLPEELTENDFGKKEHGIFERYDSL
jgi:hypothetical protein